MRNTSPYINSVWRQEAGAALWDISPHALSVLIPILGAVIEVRGVPEVDRVCAFETLHASGARASVSVTLHAVEESNNNGFSFSDGSRHATIPMQDFIRPDAFAAAVTALETMVRTGERSHPCDMRLGVEVVRVLEAAEHSQGSGDRVSS